MNYQHAFHAGNFADVFKHAFLTRIFLYLARKETPFRVLDTHAGEGAYDLSSAEADRGGEWRAGVALLRDLEDGPARDLLRPYLDCLGACDDAGRPLIYPGSPRIARTFMRANDRALFCEKRPDAYAALAKNFRRDRQVKALSIDGWMALNASIPPPERRGLVLIDPPFEEKDEFPRMAAALVGAYRKWPTGVYAAWYPVKHPAARDGFLREMRTADIAKVLRLELAVDAVTTDGRLARTGLLVINPPYVLEDEARILLPALARIFAQGPGAEAMIETLQP